MSKKLRFCAKLPTNRAFGPVRRARRGIILNEKGVRHPFFKLFPRTLLLLLCLFRWSKNILPGIYTGRMFCSFTLSATLSALQ
ncbi:hypothetical protein [Ruthenibacterium lactatiformans]|uniref:hypothetical protein n=1 Tax=Ruthenibacterium lactatiformans TaxID=1550024 RepID=UPI0010651AEB|nr:hypothetical protein [Ruthenibacterium lactatiformans]MBN3012309.1 hypothetical protein [Ruthenibacterium lactatiformans]